MDEGTKLILLDTAGSYSPVKILNEMSIIEKEATELFILDLVFEMSDYFICVVLNALLRLMILPVWIRDIWIRLIGIYKILQIKTLEKL